MSMAQNNHSQHFGPSSPGLLSCDDLVCVLRSLKNTLVTPKFESESKRR